MLGGMFCRAVRSRRETSQGPPRLHERAAAAAPPQPGHCAGGRLGRSILPRLDHLLYVMVCGVSGDLTGAKGADTVLSLTGLDEVKAHVGRELGVRDWQLVTQENLDAFAQAIGEEQFVHVDVSAARA